MVYTYLNSPIVSVQFNVLDNIYRCAVIPTITMENTQAAQSVCL